MATINPTFPAVGQDKWGTLLNGDLQSVVDLLNRHELTTIGVGTTAGTPTSVAIGASATASAANAIAIGTASATASNSAAIGLNASTMAQKTVAIGPTAFINASGTQGVAIGDSAVVSASQGIALGSLAQVTASGGVALGVSSVASGANAIAVGNGAQATAATTIAIGSGAKATATNGTAVGSNTLADMSGGINTAIVANSIAAGLAQLTEKAMRFTTTNATLRNNQFLTSSFSFTRFEATVLARRINANVARIWTVAMHIERISGNYRLVGTPTVVDVAQDAGSETWVVTASAPAGIGPTINTTGAASTTIEWSIVGRMEELRAAFTSA